MVDNNDTREEQEKLHPAQTRDAAREAGRILQSAQPPIVAESDRQTVYLETGAGLVLTLTNEGRFMLIGQEAGGRELITFTVKETQAIYSFWWSICAPGIVEHLPAALEYVKAQRAQEETHGND